MLPIRCVERAQAAESEREEAVARLRSAVEEAAELKGRLKNSDLLQVWRKCYLCTILLCWWLSMSPGAQNVYFEKAGRVVNGYDLVVLFGGG